MYLFFHSLVVNLLLQFSLWKIPELVVQTIHQFPFSQASSMALALSDPSLKMLHVPEMEPFVSSRGPNPGSDVQGLPTNPYTTGPFGNDLLAQAKVSPELVWMGARTRFPHPGRG